MSGETKKVGIKETLEALDFLGDFVAEIAKHKKDDGKIDFGEWIKTAAEVAPEGVKAFLGAGEIQAEVKDLDEKEIGQIAEKAVGIAKKIGEVFAK